MGRYINLLNKKVIIHRLIDENHLFSLFFLLVFKLN